jgi:hypothetical protein
MSASLPVTLTVTVLLTSLMLIPLSVIYNRVSHRLPPLFKPQYKPFPTIDRINESDLTFDNWFNNYLVPGAPLIIVHDDESPVLKADSNTGNLIRESMLKNCGESRIDLASTMIKRFVTTIDPNIEAILDWSMWLFNNETLEHWKEDRFDVKLEDFGNSQSVTGIGVPPPPPPLPPPFTLPSRLRSFLPPLTSFLPSLMSTLLTLTSRPPYLADKRPEAVCFATFYKKAFEAMKEFGDDEQHSFMNWTKVEKLTAELLHDREQETGVYSLGDWEHRKDHVKPPDPSTAKYNRSKPNPDKIFWGGKDASSYPLHRDENDADTFFTFWSGCKEFIVVPQDERSALERMNYPGFQMWYNDLFETGMPIAMARGWKDTVLAGETLYMPGEMLHEVRTACYDTINVCRRPWRATAVRDIGDDTARLWKEIEIEEVERRSWLFWGMGRIRKMREFIQLPE